MAAARLEDLKVSKGHVQVGLQPTEEVFPLALCLFYLYIHIYIHTYVQSFDTSIHTYISSILAHPLVRMPDDCSRPERRRAPSSTAAQKQAARRNWQLTPTTRRTRPPRKNKKNYQALWHKPQKPMVWNYWRLQPLGTHTPLTHNTTHHKHNTPQTQRTNKHTTHHTKHIILEIVTDNIYKIVAHTQTHHSTQTHTQHTHKHTLNTQKHTQHTNTHTTAALTTLFSCRSPPPSPRSVQKSHAAFARAFGVKPASDTPSKKPVKVAPTTAKLFAAPTGPRRKVAPELQ
jgi:hypothetical protein